MSRLYVAHTGADRIEVIDCLTNSHVGSLPDVPGVAGVLIDSEQDFLFSSDRGCARVSIYRCSDETLLGRVGVGERPNGLAYDPARRRLFVFNIGDPPGVNCTVSVVAVDEMRVIATIPLPGRPRWAVYDAATEHIYANVQKPAQIVVLNAKDLKIARAFNVPTRWATRLGDFWRAAFLCGRWRGTDCAGSRHAEQCSAASHCRESPMSSCTIRLRLACTWPSDRRESSALSTTSAWRRWSRLKLSPEPIPLAGTRTPVVLYAFLPASGGAAVFAEQ